MHLDGAVRGEVEHHVFNLGELFRIGVYLKQGASVFFSVRVRKEQ